MFPNWLDEAAYLLISNGLIYLILFLCLVNAGFCVRYIVRHHWKQRSVIYFCQMILNLAVFAGYLFLMLGIIPSPTMQSVVAGRMFAFLLLLGYLMALIVDN